MPKRGASFGKSFDVSFKEISGGFDRKETSYQKKIELDEMIRHL